MLMMMSEIDKLSNIMKLLVNKNQEFLLNKVNNILIK